MEDVNCLLLFRMDSSQYVLDYSCISRALSLIDNKLAELREMQNSEFDIFFIKLQGRKLFERNLEHGLQLKAKIGQHIREILSRFSNYICEEIQYLKQIIL